MTIAVHLPDDLEADLDAYADTQSFGRSSAVRKLLADGLAQWRREKAIAQLRDGEVTFARAAEIAGMNVRDFPDLLSECDVTWISESHLRADLDVIAETE